MITECYIKGRFDYGVGKCAVVIVESDIKARKTDVLHQVGWVIPTNFEYKCHKLKADQFNCEILAALYAVTWCLSREKKLINIYANTTSCEKWYQRRSFPEGRVLADLYTELTKDVDITADFIPKADENEFNRLVNSLAESAK